MEVPAVKFLDELPIQTRGSDRNNLEVWKVIRFSINLDAERNRNVPDGRVGRRAIGLSSYSSPLLRYQHSHEHELLVDVFTLHENNSMSRNMHHSKQLIPGSMEIHFSGTIDSPLDREVRDFEVFVPPVMDRNMPHTIPVVFPLPQSFPLKLGEMYYTLVRSAQPTLSSLDTRPNKSSI